jgi:hypothetical protein
MYAQAKDYLVSELKYPEAFRTFSNFDPKFAIRGLTFDRKTGLFLKINFLHSITLSAVFLGRQVELFVLICLPTPSLP